ncbi:MAG TPA: hypothetical protein VG123_29760 [Streptosporangiaceae bacterium]|nr:hypothetical protein [Streptosporangiaceae bacterium]
MHPILGKVLATAAAALALAAPTAGQAGRASPGAPRSPHVIVAGIGGLRWSDISPVATPTLWRLASQGSVGSLDVTGISTRTCPVDGWLTLNSAARATAPHAATGRCPANHAIVISSATTPAPAQISRFPALIRYNARFSWNPQWGLLATAPGPGRCATAAGPGAALALATPAGRVSSYLPSPSQLTPAILARCPLTVADLGNLPTAPGPAGRSEGAGALRAAGRSEGAGAPRPVGRSEGAGALRPAGRRERAGALRAPGRSERAGALRAADQQLASLTHDLPPAATLLVLAPGDGSEPHLRVIIVTGPGYRPGLLAAASTRQPGLVTLTDVTPSILGWLGAPVPAAATGSPIHAGPRASLAAAIRALLQQDTAAQVYRQTMTPFFLLTGFGGALLFALIAVIPWGQGERRRSRRRVAARTAGLWAASIPAGTFLASLVPWWALPHPAAVLYTLTVTWAVVIAAAALAGPWRKDPLGPPGVVAAVTLGVLAVDLMTGSHLVRDTPFGLTPLGSGRFYGLGNNAVVIYGASAVLAAAWLGGTLLRRGQRTAAMVCMAAVTGFAAAVSGWPGFGAKVGGTVAMLPGFLLFLAAAAGIRITARRLALAAVSGVALVALFALANYFLPVTGHSHIGAFAGRALHGQAGPTLRRKVSSNLSSLGGNPFVLVIPAVLVLAGLAIGWPDRLRATPLARAFQRIPLLRPALASSWLIAVLCWFAEDNGVTVPAFGLPLLLPLVIAIVCSPPAGGSTPGRPGPPAAPAVPGKITSRGRAGHATDASTAGPGQPGYR